MSGDWWSRWAVAFALSGLVVILREAAIWRRRAELLAEQEEWADHRDAEGP
jgi:hypothetical protein